MPDDETAKTKPYNPSSIQGPWKLLAIALVIFLGAARGRGQAPSARSAQADSTTDYSKEAFIIEKLRTVTRFENDGTSTRTTTREVRVQSEAGVQHWGVLRQVPAPLEEPPR